MAELNKVQLSWPKWGY